MKELLNQYKNATCEVKTMENDLLLLGKVREIVDGLSLSIDIVGTDGSPLPQFQYGVPVKLNLYSSTHGMLVIGGRVYMTNPAFWRVSNISQYQHIERRSFFRVVTHAAGLVSSLPTPGQEPPPAFAAQLINISLSGVLFSAACSLDEGELVQLYRVRLVDDMPPFAFCCRIRSVETTSKDVQLYRCSFENLEQKETDRLCKAVFALQRELIKKQRNRM